MGQGLLHCDTSTGICQCSLGCLGPDCSQCSNPCPNDCSGKGHCDPSTGICQCSLGCFGQDCSNCDSSCPNDCSGNGICDPSTGTCQCDSGCSGKCFGSDPSYPNNTAPQMIFQSKKNT